MMSAPQVVMVVAGAMVVAPTVAALVLIAVGLVGRPRYARVAGDIDDRSPSAPRPTLRESPGSSVADVGTLRVPTSVRVDPGPQALRDVVDSRAGRGAEVFGS